MTAGPGDQGAAQAAARGYLRASHADRERVIAVLKAAFVQGMLAKAELDARLGQTFAARTHRELAALTADLPAGLADVAPPRPAARAQARPPMSNAAKAGICVAVVVAVTAVMAVATGGLALVLCVPFYFLALLVAGAQMLASRHEKRSRGQLPPRQAQFGGALEDERDGGPGNDLVLCGVPGDTRGRRLRGHSVTRRLSRPVPARRASTSLCT